MMQEKSAQDILDEAVFEMSEENDKKYKYSDDLLSDCLARQRLKDRGLI